MIWLGSDLRRKGLRTPAESSLELGFKEPYPQPSLGSTNISSLLNKFMTPPHPESPRFLAETPSHAPLSSHTCHVQCLCLCLEFCIFISPGWGSSCDESLEDQAIDMSCVLSPAAPRAGCKQSRIWLRVMISFHVLNQRHRDNNFPNIVLRDLYHCKTIFRHQAVSEQQYRLADTRGWGGS